MDYILLRLSRKWAANSLRDEDLCEIFDAVIADLDIINTVSSSLEVSNSLLSLMNDMMKFLDESLTLTIQALFYSASLVHLFAHHEDCRSRIWIWIQNCSPPHELNSMFSIMFIGLIKYLSGDSDQWLSTMILTGLEMIGLGCTSNFELSVDDILYKKVELWIDFLFQLFSMQATLLKSPWIRENLHRVQSCIVEAIKSSKQWQDSVIKRLLSPFLAFQDIMHQNIGVGSLWSCCLHVNCNALSSSSIICILLSQPTSHDQIFCYLQIQSRFWPMILAFMCDNDLIIRKRGVFVLQSLPSRALGDRFWWELYVDIYQQVEGCKSEHLVEQIWPILESLLAQSTSPSCCVESVPRLSFKWMTPLIHCLLSSQLLTIRRQVLYRLFSCKLVVNPLDPEFQEWFVEELLLRIDDTNYFPSNFIPETTDISNISFCDATDEANSLNIFRGYGINPSHYPGVLLPHFLHRIFKSLPSDSAKTFVRRIIHGLCHGCIHMQRHQLGIQSFAAAKWILRSFASAPDSSLPMDCVGNAEFADLKLFFSNSMACCNKLVKSQVLVGFLSLLFHGLDANEVSDVSLVQFVYEVVDISHVYSSSNIMNFLRSKLKTMLRGAENLPVDSIFWRAVSQGLYCILCLSLQQEVDSSSHVLVEEVVAFSIDDSSHFDHIIEYFAGLSLVLSTSSGHEHDSLLKSSRVSEYEVLLQEKVVHLLQEDTRISPSNSEHLIEAYKVLVDVNPHLIDPILTKLAVAIASGPSQRQYEFLFLLSLLLERVEDVEGLEVFNSVMKITPKEPLEAIMESSCSTVSFDRYSHYVNAFYQIKWRVLHLLIQKSTFKIVDDVFLSITAEGLEVSNTESLAEILSCCTHYLNKTNISTNQSKMQCWIVSLLSISWNGVLDNAQGLDIHAFESFVSFLFSPAVVRISSFDIILEYYENILSLGMKNRPHVIQYLAFKLCALWTQSVECIASFLPHVVPLLLYCEPIIDSCSVADSSLDSQTISRYLLLSHFEQLMSSRNDELLLKESFNDLILKMISLNLTKSYLESAILGSPKYCEKLLSWQGLCILVPIISERTLTRIMADYFKILDHTCAHPIRVHMEIFGGRIALEYPELMLTRLIEALQDFDHSQQTLASLFVIVGHVISIPHDILIISKYASSLLDAVLPWLSCANSLPRAIAQLCAFKLIPRVIDTHDDIVGRDRYGQTLMASYRCLSTNRDSMKILQRQSQFFENYGLKKLTTVAGIYSLKHDSNSSGKIQATDHILTILNDLIKENMQLEKERDAEMTMTPAMSKGRGEPATLQVKRIPHTDLLLQYREESRSRQVNVNTPERQSIIIVATLLDKTKNLAGIARTSEVFGVQGLVVGDMSVVKSSDFLNIAVSSSQWLPIVEVKEQNLKEYLWMKKREGYRVIGVEQTDSSQSLESFKFPKKSILLLGREKQGLPVEYLNIVDDCVEVPQRGVIRSLNVHVCASIVLWEYTRQYLQ